MRRRTARWPAVLLAALLLLPGCGPAYTRYQASFFDVFDTQTTFTAFATSREAFQQYADIVHGELRRLHQLFDIYNPYEGINNLHTVNSAAGIAAVPVDEAILDLLEKAVEAERYTAGAVNVALGPVLAVWHDYRAAALADPAAAALPPEDILRAANAHTDINGLLINREAGTVRLEAGMALDVGAIAKGYAAQAAMDKAAQAGLTSGLLNAGGNVCAIGKPLDGRDSWTVGVQAPDLTAEGAQENWDLLAVAHGSVVTSGDYQRFYEVDGVAYHHIIDPWALRPADRARAVTVIHPDGTVADVLSTAAFILPQGAAEQLVVDMGGEAVWLFADGTFATTEGYAAYSQNYGG